MERITTLNGFEAERERWERLYRADPLGHVFLSWAWLRAYLAQAAPGWLILVLRESNELVAALPLQLRGVPMRRVPVARELAFTSEPIADYQGLLCLPNRETDAIRAFAESIRTLPWDRAVLRDVIDPRFAQLLAHVAVGGGAVSTTGHTRCLRTTLPDTWDAYLASLGSNTRAKTARALRKLTSLPNFRLTTPRGGDVDAQIDAVVRMNHARWGGNLRSARATFGRLFRDAHEQGCLRLIVAWDAERPIAGVASFTDDVHATYNVYQLAHEREYGQYSPGKVIAALAIRDAIESGYRVFDFLRGDEAYKASFARDVATTTHFHVRRRTARAALFDTVHPAYRALKAAAVRVVYGPGRTIS